MSTTVTYKNQIVTTVTNTTKELTTRGKYLEDNIHLTDVSSAGGNLQEKTGVNPATVSQTLTPDPGYDGFSSVQINAMPTGSEGTPIATKGAVQEHALAVTPSVVNTAGYIPGGTRTGAPVSVAASELVSGTLTPDSAGTKDVTNYQYVQLNAGSLSNPTGLKGSVSNHQVSITPRAHYDGGFANTVTKYGTAITVTAAELASGTKTITQNGTGIDVVGYESVDVNVSGGGEDTELLTGEFTYNKTYNVTKIGRAFSNCTGAVDINFPNVTSLRITNYAFENSLFNSLNFPILAINVNTAFRNFKGAHVNAPNITEIGNQGFEGCSNLLEAFFPKAKINTGTFRNCTSIVTAVIKCTGANYQGFQGCTALTGCDYVGYLAGNKIDNMFQGCTSLNKMIIRATTMVPLTNQTAFSDTDFGPLGNGGTLYVPNSLITTYQNDTYWSIMLSNNTNNTIQAIEGSYYETHYVDGTLIS